MKKNYFVYILLIIFSFIVGNVEVLATYDTNTTSNIIYDATLSIWYDDLKKNDTVPVCEYVDTAGVTKAGIYYKFGVNNSSKISDINHMETRYYPFGLWSVVGQHSSYRILKNIGYAGKMDNVFDLSNNVIHSDAALLDTVPFTCPSVSNIGEIDGKASICFHYGDLSWCGGDFQSTSAELKLKTDGSILYDIYNYSTYSVYKNISLEEYLNNSEDIVTFIQKNTEEYIYSKYKLSDEENASAFKSDSFIREYVNNDIFSVRPNDAFLRFLKKMAEDSNSNIDSRVKADCNIYLKTYQDLSVSRDELILEKSFNPDLDTNNFCSRIYTVSDEVIEEEENEEESSTVNPPTFDSMKPDDFSTNCQEFAGIIRMGGYILFLAKIALPLIIIVKASLNVFSIVTNGSSEEFRKQAQKFMTSIIAAVAIFFIPTLINVVFGFISNYNENMTEDSKVCAACIFEPFSSSCTDYID